MSDCAVRDAGSACRWRSRGTARRWAFALLRLLDLAADDEHVAAEATAASYDTAST